MDPLSTKILIVDDSAFMRRVVSLILKKRGFGEIFEAESALEAFRLCTQYRPDLIILDLIMPDVDGFYVLKEIKKIAPATKILVLTADGQEWTIRMARESGACACLIKPFDLDVLCDAVFEALNEKIGLQKLYDNYCKLTSSRTNGGVLLGK
ncbi:MAG: response regulator [Candidatus Methanomethyliaceae archaeon]|nr:response regulator [Candidatus Methanomethyliaceae archaeon]